MHRTLARPDRRVAPSLPVLSDSDLVEDPGRIVSETVMQKLSRKLDPKHSIVVTDVGQHQMWTAQFISRSCSRVS